MLGILGKISQLLTVLPLKLFTSMKDKKLSVDEIFSITKTAVAGIGLGEQKIAKIGIKEKMIIKECIEDILKKLEDRELTISETIEFLENTLKKLGFETQVLIDFSGKK